MTTVGDMLYHLGGVPVGMGAELTTGNVYFVDDSGSNSNAGTDKNSPVADLDYAIGLCTANQGDTIYVMPGHAETANTQITCDVAGVTIIGLGRGADIPTITANASAVDCFNVTAASVTIRNIMVLGAASCTALVNVAAGNFTAEDCIFEQVATPTTGVTIASGGNDYAFRRCQFRGSVDGPNFAIDIEAKITGHNYITDCMFNYSPAGLDDAAIRCNAFAVVGLEVNRCTFIGMEVTAIDINSSDTDGGDGLIANCSIAAKGAVANIDTLIDAGGCVLIQNYGSDTAAEGGGLVPVTTPA